MPWPSVELIERDFHDMIHEGCREFVRGRAAAASATRTKAHKGAPVVAVEAASAAATCTTDRCVTVATGKTPARASLARGAPTTAVKASTDNYWILAHECDDSDGANVTAGVRVRDAILCQDASDQHVKMHVLGWNSSEAVLGCVVRGDTHLRVLATRDFPRDTMDQVKRIKDNVRVAYEHTYTIEHFLASTYERQDGSRQNVFFIAELSEARPGPLLGYTCNQVMPCLPYLALSCATRSAALPRCATLLRCAAKHCLAAPKRQPARRCPCCAAPDRAFLLVLSYPSLPRRAFPAHAPRN